jgi:DNA-binding MarR family transcriptional regulator
MSQPNPPVAADTELASRLRLAIGRLARRIRLDVNDLPPLQLSALFTIEQCGPLRLGELAQREAVTAPTMSRVLAALTEQQLIERQADQADARSVRVSVAPAGSALLAELRTRRTASIARRLERLDNAQRALLLAALPALEALVEDEPAP